MNICILVQGFLKLLDGSPSPTVAKEGIDAFDNALMLPKAKGDIMGPLRLINKPLAKKLLKSPGIPEALLTFWFVHGVPAWRSGTTAGQT